MNVLGVFLVFAVLALMLRLALGSMDEERLHDYVKKHGWTLISCSWDPLGPGWFGEQSNRIYRVVYEDEQGIRYEAGAKTSVFGGVYLTNQCQVRSASPDADSSSDHPPDQDLRAENERLRARLRELEGERHRP